MRLVRKQKQHDMKKIVYSLFVLLFAMMGCMHENILQPEPKLSEGDEITVRFNATIPEFKTAQTRANGGVNDMWILVFDQNATFIVRRPATLSNQTDNGGVFTATLPSSTDTRYVHFVCNYDWTGFNDSDMIGANAAAVVALMSTSDATFWGRKDLTNGINANSFSDPDDPVVLLRNQAKITVTEEADNFTLTGFTIHKAPSTGTVAPFNTSNYQFEEGAITEPIGVTLTDAVQTDINNLEKYIFERKNRSATEITTVILEGVYNGTTYFYKIDLVDANRVRYNIERNYHYAVTISSVTKEGYTNFTDALNSPSHNNTALDPIIERYPMISDGISKLEVEKTLVVMVEPNEPFSVWVKYYPDINSTDFDNTDVTVTLESDDDGALADGTLTFDAATGIVSATTAAILPTTPVTARIIVSKGDLARPIRVILRPAFSFNPVTINDLSPAMLPVGQNQDATLRFIIPADFPTDLLPLPIKIYTQGLYPATSGLQMVVEQGIIHYIYNAATTGLQTVEFKTNKSGNTETVTLESDYFEDGTVDYASPFEITGTIRYQPNPPNGSTTAVPSGALTVTGIGTGTYSNSSGYYILSNIPADTPGDAEITFTYVRGWPSSGTYTATRTLDQLRDNPNVVVVR